MNKLQKIGNLLKQFVTRIKNTFKLTPEQIHHAEIELKHLFGMIKEPKDSKDNQVTEK